MNSILNPVRRFYNRRPLATVLMVVVGGWLLVLFVLLAVPK